jgi:hypothetical protein
MIRRNVDEVATATTNVPTIASSIPPKFRSSFNEASLREAEWLRLPLPGDRCPLTGLSRTSIIELGERAAIKLIRVRKPGALRGIVLVHKGSLLSFLEHLAEAPTHS